MEGHGRYVRAIVEDKTTSDMGSVGGCWTRAGVASSTGQLFPAALAPLRARWVGHSTSESDSMPASDRERKVSAVAASVCVAGASTTRKPDGPRTRLSVIAHRPALAYSSGCGIPANGGRHT